MTNRWNWWEAGPETTPSAGQLGVGNPGSYGGINTANSMIDMTNPNTYEGGGIDWGGWASNFGNVTKGIGGLAQAWQGLQGLKLAKDQLRIQNEQWQKNYDAQRNDIEYDRSRRAAARSRQRGGRVF